MLSIGEAVAAAIEEQDRALVSSPEFQRLMLLAQRLGLWPELLREPRSDQSGFDTKPEPAHALGLHRDDPK